MQRLKTRAQFQAVMAAGVCARTPHFVLHCLTLDSRSCEAAPSSQDATGPGNLPQALFAVAGADMPTIWMGPLVPKRWARRSVTRHLLRRQVYAVAAEYAEQLPAHTAYVVRLRAEFSRKQFVSASSELLRRAVRTELQRLFGYATRATAYATRATAAATEPAVRAAPEPPAACAAREPDA